MLDLKKIPKGKGWALAYKDIWLSDWAVHINNEIELLTDDKENVVRCIILRETDWNKIVKCLRERQVNKTCRQKRKLSTHKGEE